VGSAGGGGGACGWAGGGGGAWGSAGGGGACRNVLPDGGGGGGGVGTGSAWAAVGNVSTTTVAPVSAAILSVFDRPLRC